MTDPVKALQIVKQRLARLAAVRTLTASLPPLIVLVGAALGWRAVGFRLGSAGALCCAAIGAPCADRYFGRLGDWPGGRGGSGIYFLQRSEDTAEVAELVDRKLGSHEEVLTLADAG